jgi:Na+-translocating ferredoxin:NAD+ oxidoreductase subunit G
MFSPKTLMITCTCLLSLGLLPRARAEQFWTPAALLREQFKSSEHVGYVKVPMAPAERARLETRLGRERLKAEYTIFVAKTQQHIDGYALFDEQLGQHEPISFATFFDPAGRVTRVEVVAYREPYGDGIRAERFRRQFVGRTAQSHFRTGEDIDIVSGATISSRSMCIAVERAAVILEAARRKSADGSLATQ